ncbi:sialidase family protein [Paenibacillus sp. RC67]|uniref:sialidase family protein n=1 Tax=Paenibacillus sp. RC67 TaxID=3039392 RepID=UPI0024AE5DEB|nr:sialidase family protein [Paenibacillus sp. RC67]
MANIPVTSGTSSQQEPSISVNTLDNLTVIVTSNDTSFGNDRTSTYLSTDGGLTYPTKLTFPLPTGFNASGDGVGAYGYRSRFSIGCTALNVGSSGVSDSSIVVYNSTNNGASFSGPVIVNEGFGTQVYNDKPYIAIDSSNGSPFLGFTYVAFTRYYNNFASSETLFQRSLDQGQTWSTPILLSNQVQGIAVFGSTISIGALGEVYVGWMQYSPGTPQFLIRRSDDGGVTFGPIATVSTVSLVPSPLPVPGFGFRTLTSAYLATDISPNLGEGIVYAAWQDNRTGSAHIFLSRSTDKGTTWSVPIQVDDSPAGTQNFFPGIAVSRLTGRLDIIYYTNRVTTTLLDVFLAESDNAGSSFLASRRLSDNSFDPNADPTFGEPCTTIGDYIEVAFIDSDVPLAVWTGIIGGIQNIIQGS